MSGPTCRERPFSTKAKGTRAWTTTPWSLQARTTGPPAHTRDRRRKPWGHPAAVGLVLRGDPEEQSLSPRCLKRNSTWGLQETVLLLWARRAGVPHSQGGVAGIWEDGVLESPDPLNAAFLNGVSWSSRLANWKGMSWYGFVIYLSDVHKWSKNNASFVEKGEIKMPGIWPFRSKTCRDRADWLAAQAPPTSPNRPVASGPPCTMEGCVEIRWLQSIARKEYPGRFHRRRSLGVLED